MNIENINLWLLCALILQYGLVLALTVNRLFHREDGLTLAVFGTTLVLFFYMINELYGDVNWRDVVVRGLLLGANCFLIIKLKINALRLQS
jgi:hypothetical protein